jgi:hypothetical protein
MALFRSRAVQGMVDKPSTKDLFHICNKENKRNQAIFCIDAAAAIVHPNVGITKPPGEQVGYVRKLMTRVPLILLFLGFVLACSGVTPARSEQLRIALVISNEQYASMPALARCSASATVVRDALRGIGFDVVERSNLSRGEFDTAIGALARRAAASPSALAALYYCGYAVEFNGRSFVLPTSANITRDYDVLTQGIISKSLVDSLIRAKESTGFVLLDVFRTPDTSATTGLGGLIEQMQPSNFAVIGSSNNGAAEGPTAASLALRDQAAERELSLGAFINGMRRQLSKDAAVTAHFVSAIGSPSFLAGGPRVASPSAAAQPTASTAPAAAAVRPAPSVEAPPAAPPPPRQVMADEDQMSEQDRRRIQVILATMGYYAGRIDGTFGPETRAAIRRYQFEIKAELTGHLNAEQATRLVNTVR